MLERYFESEDETWGKTLGRVRFASDTLHDVRSISKSIVALVYGAALAEKKVPPPGEPLFTQFPEYADVFDADERRKRLTIEHALTMTLGTAWDETIPWNDPREQRAPDGGRAGSLSLHPGTARRRGAGPALGLQRARDRTRCSYRDARYRSRSA